VYYVYLLRSISHPAEIYTGFTDDLRHRVNQHNCGRSAYTRKFMPWELAFYAAFQKEVTARRFESYLKSGSGRAFTLRHLVAECTRTCRIKIMLRSNSQRTQEGSGIADGRG
jgi:putative endonuclease